MIRWIVFGYDITEMVDCALKTNYLPTFPSPVLLRVLLSPNETVRKEGVGELHEQRYGRGEMGELQEWRYGRGEMGELHEQRYGRGEMGELQEWRYGRGEMGELQEWRYGRVAGVEVSER